MRRRDCLPLVPLLLAAGPVAARAPVQLRFPRDHGAHPGVRTEWWYVTGALESGARTFGFQGTFFRSRVEATQQLRSKFAARQLVFAHAALTDVEGRKLWHDQRIAREGFDVALAAEGDTRLKLRDWRMDRAPDGNFRLAVAGTDFAFDLRCAPTQAVLLQGQQGLSRKGPDAQQASYYYSVPQLAVTGTLRLHAEQFTASGKAWLDHEWSDAFLHPQAVGWDWIGMNLDDGSALTAFRLRRADGSTLWDGGSFRSVAGRTYIASRGETEFRPQRRWTSPWSKASYPVEWMVRTPADFYTVRALVDDQELDSRSSTGAIYWEGLAELLDGNGRKVGRGYLEMTGYAQPLRL
jgi:predicted secreted hydrolase